MGWWRSARWSDFRVALMLLAEERDAEEAARAARDAESAHGPGFGEPPPDHVLRLLQREE